MDSRIKILEPCHQNWDKMTISGKDKFCQKCQKSVVDFTAYNRRELLQKLNGQKGICGRIDLNQLNQINSSENISKPNFYKWSILISLSSILGLSQPTLSNNLKPGTEILQNENWKTLISKKEINDSITIKGKVFDENNLPIPGTNVVLKGTKIGVQTDFDGFFSFTIPEDKLNSENYLTFSFIGYKTNVYRFYRANKYLKINLDPDTSVMGEIVIVGRPNLFRKVGNFFHNLFSNHKTCN